MDDKYLVFEVTDKGIKQISQEFEIPAEAEAFIQTMRMGFLYKKSDLVIGKITIIE